MKKNKIKIFDLYFHFLINKIVLLAIIISLVIISIILYILAKNTYILPAYLYNPEGTHLNYFRISFFIIFIFNSIIIALITITYTTNSALFDILFIADRSKINIGLIKIFCGIIVIITIILAEYLIYNLICVFYFKEYILKLEDLFSLYQLISMGIIEYLFSLLVTTIINQTIIPLLAISISIMMKLICNNILKFKEVYEKILPIYSYHEDIMNKTGSFLALIWIIILIFMYLLVYDLKDIKY